MNISISGKQTKVGKSLTIYARDNIISALKKYFDKFVEVETSEGKICEYLGVSKTSSYVNASLIGSIILYIWFFEKKKST